MLYADSSFIVSCYVLDANTPTAKAYLLGTNESVAWTSLHALEIRNALELGVFRGLLKPADIVAAWQNLQGDLKTHRLVRAQVVWRPRFERLAGLADVTQRGQGRVALTYCT